MGKSVDVGVWKAGERIAIEIEMSPSHALENITKDLADGWDRVVVATADEKVARKIRHEVLENLAEEYESGRIEFIPVGFGPGIKSHRRV